MSTQHTWPPEVANNIQQMVKITTRDGKTEYWNPGYRFRFDGGQGMTITDHLGTVAYRRSVADLRIVDMRRLPGWRFEEVVTNDVESTNTALAKAEGR